MSRRLNDKQIATLKIVLRFRYVTTNNLVVTRNITHNSAYSSLEILHKTGYLGKIHDKSFRLLNKPARYYLTQKAVVYLQNMVSLDLPAVLWNGRKRDNKWSSDFTDKQVSIHAAYNILINSFEKNVQINTSLEMYGMEGIIRPYPNLLVEPETGKNFFVELTEDEHIFLTRKRIRKYIENYEEYNWKWEKYPDVYLIRSSADDRTKLRKYADIQKENGYLNADNFSFYIVSDVIRIKT